MAHIIIAYLAKLSGVLTSKSCSEFKCGHKSDKSDNTTTGAAEQGGHSPSLPTIHENSQEKNIPPPFNE